MTNVWVTFQDQMSTTVLSKIKPKHHLGQLQKTSVSECLRGSSLAQVNMSTKLLQNMDLSTRLAPSLPLTHSRWRQTLVLALTVQTNTSLQTLSTVCDRSWLSRNTRAPLGLVPTETSVRSTINQFQVQRWAKTIERVIISYTHLLTRNRNLDVITCTTLPTMKRWEYPSSALAKMRDQRISGKHVPVLVIMISRQEWLMEFHASRCQADAKIYVPKLAQMAKVPVLMIHGIILSRKMVLSSLWANSVVMEKLAYTRTPQEQELITIQLPRSFELSLQVGGKHQ